MKSAEITINQDKYFLDFIEKKLFNKNGERVKNELSILRLYIIQEGIDVPKNSTNQSYIGAIKKQLKNKSSNSVNDVIQSERKQKIKDKVDQNIGKVVISNGKVFTEYFSRHSKRHETEIKPFIDLVEHLIDTHTILQINESLFTPKNIYNSFIQKNVVEKPGVYIWYDNKNKEVIYVGMAGKIKTSGQLTNHPISQRLQAPRIKDKTTEKEITTKNYIPAILELLELTEIEFYILPCKENEPAAFIESILLYNYFKQHGVLPILNNAY
jgi:hypothetical protein